MAAQQQLARAHYRRQHVIVRRVATRAQDAWRHLDDANLSASWAQLAPAVYTAVHGGQLLAAGGADDYVTAAARAAGLEEPADGRVNPAAFAGVASDGRDLASLLELPLIDTKQRLAAGQNITDAKLGGLSSLIKAVSTQVADAGRTAVGAGIAAHRHLGGYYRQLSPPSCSRCVVLAGKFYRWNTGFTRHPLCDCVHIPAAEADEDLALDEKAYFESLPAGQQDRTFTAAGAQAIRDGADISQVVNARRGAAGLTPAGARITGAEARALRGGLERGQLTPVTMHGRQVFITTEGTTARGVSGARLGARQSGTNTAGQRYRRAQVARLMPESIYALAEDRDDAIRLLRRYGYLI